MNITNRARRIGAGFAALAFVAATAGCGLEKQSAPPLAGPSEFGTSITLTASPDTLNRDGASQSVITLVARDSENRPVSGLTLTMDANAGLLSAGQVMTGADGRASLTFTAPSLQEVVNTAVVRALPVGTNIDNAAVRSVSIALLAPASASPSFTVSPQNPVAFELTTLDASATTIGGQPCSSACTYAWEFGSEATASGQIVTYRFQQEGVYVVKLTVTSPGGVMSTTTRTVSVGPSVAPTAIFTFSPTNPKPGDTVRFNGSSSTGANGATIQTYAWDFGNGAALGSGPTPETVFPQERTYLVRLTVTDTRGRTATVTATVNVTF